MEKFIDTLLGGMEPAVFAAYFLIAFFGAFLAIALRAENARKKTAHSPQGFDWRFFFRDNIMKFIINVFGLAPVIIFSKDALGQEMTGWLAFVYGAAGGGVAILLQRAQNKARK